MLLEFHWTIRMQLILLHQVLESCTGFEKDCGLEEFPRTCCYSDVVVQSQVERECPCVPLHSRIVEEKLPRRPKTSRKSSVKVLETSNMYCVMTPPCWRPDGWFLYPNGANNGKWSEIKSQEVTQGKEKNPASFHNANPSYL